MWLTAEPIHFQSDGRLTVELGSTMADDEEQKVTKANNLYTMFNGNPGINQQTLARDVLVAYGKGPKLSEYLQEPQPPPPEPPTKSSISLAMKGETTDPAIVGAMLQQAGVTPEAIEAEREKISQQAAAQMVPGLPSTTGPAPPSLPMGPNPPGLPPDPQPQPGMGMQ